MTTQPTLTDEEIDRLEGRELDESVCISLGWRWCTKLKPGIGPELVSPDCLDGRKECKRPDRDTIAYHAGKWGMPWTPFYHSDLGAAMGLLLSCIGVCVLIDGETVSVFIKYTRDGDVYRIPDTPMLIASGPKSQAASIFCRAFLKLNGRKG